MNSSTINVHRSRMRQDSAAIETIREDQNFKKSLLSPSLCLVMHRIDTPPSLSIESAPIEWFYLPKIQHNPTQGVPRDMACA